MAGRILVGVDGSEGSRRALEWAFSEAEVRTSVVEAVAAWRSAYDTPRDFDFSSRVDEAGLAEHARRRLGDALGASTGEHPAVEVERTVLEGDPAEVLCRRAGEADLLVVGSRGHGTFVGLLLGSVSSKCAHHSPVPVAIVPAPRRGEEDRTFRSSDRILAGVDGSPGSRRALRWAVDEARARRASVVALMVWRPIEVDAVPTDVAVSEPTAFPTLARYDRAAAEDASERLRHLVSEVLGASEGDVGVEPVTVEGDPAETLCQYAGEADLLVVGSRGLGPFAELTLGSVSAKCAHHSPRPVVIVPTGRDRRRTGAGGVAAVPAVPA